ncbi:putative bifunctional diguanylate cyclase/phosphodiesterase [Clostridium weizhouense]|uniref:Bifunctional diguanylate cyclase/phosphodiesterase n=1 Tax=Clostridium weizhouense TaxID=2859781 RepID=A0ABS7APL0_9CLOT|nr:bifunctional diguanylate cyclase/phosphodiesterase [Clostridium weizhouense]MBW6410597.1 bifunctional diguanylate cyclase/phosphodiesterase [Clostridium weizhouense]
MNKITKQVTSFAKEMVHNYFIKKDFKNIIKNIDENITLISSLQDEVCIGINDILSLCNLKIQNNSYNFEIQNEQYYPVNFSDKTYLVFGEVTYKIISKDHSFIKDPIRFTLLFKIYDTKLKLCHIHTSTYLKNKNYKPFMINSNKNITPSNLICFSNITNFIDRITSKDSLTGLLTLSKFEIIAKNLLNKQNEKQFALIYCDIDKFKYINETLGYAAGNKILIDFAKLSSAYLYKDELICRCSADKFIILLEYINMETLKNRLNNFNKKFIEIKKLYFNNIKISLIAGIYLIKSIDNSLISIIDKANIARKTIKGYHKSYYAFYDDKLHMQITKEKEIENLMLSSLENKEFLVYLQPKIELSSKKIVGAEALVRWLSPLKKLISPVEFIPLFEKNGFIIDLDFYVYEEVLKKMRSWIDEGKDLIPISLNVSRLHLNDTDFISRLKKLTQKYNIPTSLIELELTESIFFENVDYLLKTIEELKLLGFTCSIDDFGSGYSSLNLLKDLPIDVLKLDKDFFPNHYINKKEKVIISNIVKMAKELDITVLSEGIETEEQADFLTEIGCTMAQGYLFDKPMPINTFEKKMWE